MAKLVRMKDAYSLQKLFLKKARYQGSFFYFISNLFHLKITGLRMSIYSNK